MRFRALVERDRDLLLATAQIIRGELDGKVPAAGTTVVRSLSEVEAMFS